MPCGGRPSGEAPVRDDREGNGRGEDPDTVGERARHQEHARGGPARGRSEAPLQPPVGGILSPPEITREQERRDADPPDQVTQRQLQEGEVAPGPTALYREG